MKLSTQTIAAGVCLLMPLSLASCEKDSLLSPNQAGSTRSTALNESVQASLPRVYTLTREGNANLTYDDMGRLKRVVYGADVPENTHVEYTYNVGSIHALSYRNRTLFCDQTYQIDSRTGRCSDYAVIIYQDGKTKRTNVAFTYDEKGRLIRSSDYANALIRTDYAYNETDDLVRATRFAIDPKTALAVIRSDYRLRYGQPDGSPAILDRNAMNLPATVPPDPYLTSSSSSTVLPDPYLTVSSPSTVPPDPYLTSNSPSTVPPDPYLPIFGKRNTHLVQAITEVSSVGGTYYTNKLNADGYVMERNEWTLKGNTLIGTKRYDYLITELKSAQ